MNNSSNTTTTPVKLMIFGLLLIAGLHLNTCKSGPETDVSKAEKPGNIVLMIGDGMGVAQIYAGLTANGGRLNLESSQYVGFQKTHAANSYITDSGASGTAMATGKKTYNGAIAVDNQGNTIKTILEMAEEKGLSTGLISTSSITHATPASFVAHCPDRDKYEEIALDFIDAGLEVIIGGGRHHFNRREDGLDLLERLREDGYLVTDQIAGVEPGHDGPIAVFTDSIHMPPAARGREDLLPRATELALRRLSTSTKGFFLMVEAAQIDWAAHANHTEYMVSEMIDFDVTIGKAFDFARMDGETLVIITADHETGGLSIENGDIEAGEVTGKFRTDGHTGIMVPVFAYGPGAEKFAGIYDNTDIFEKMAGLLDLK
jgi:alkaline phosphatase